MIVKNGDKSVKTEMGNFWQRFSIGCMTARAHRNILQVKLYEDKGAKPRHGL